MGLSITISLTLITLLIFILSKKKLSFLKNAIVFIVMSILIKNYLTLINMNFKLIKITLDDSLFIALLLYRELIIPFYILLFINRYFFTKKKWLRCFLFIIFASIIQGFEMLMVNFQVITYVNYSLTLSFLVNFSYLIISIGLANLLFIIEKREPMKYEKRV